MQNKAFRQCGDQFESTARINMSGPVQMDDVPPPIKELLANSSLRVTQVIVVHRDLNTDDNPQDGYVWVYSNFSDPKTTTTKPASEAG